MQQDAAVFVGNEDQRAGGGVEQLKPAVGTLDKIFALQGAGHNRPLIGKTLAQRGRAVQHIGQRAFALADKMGRRQRGLDGAHNAQAQHQHGGDGRKKLAADRVAAAHSLTSNL